MLGHGPGSCLTQFSTSRNISSNWRSPIWPPSDRRSREASRNPVALAGRVSSRSNALRRSKRSCRSRLALCCSFQRVHDDLLLLVVARSGHFQKAVRGTPAS